jgi:hypothetical protein
MSGLHYAKTSAVYSGNLRSLNICSGKIADLYEIKLAVASVVTLL